jgi:hypothetical protein
MKLIITEEQLRLIIENEGKGENLIDLTDVYKSGVSPNKWDDIFLLLKEKKERKGDKTYDGYYIDGVVSLFESEVTELKYLVKVGDRLILSYSKISSLPILEYVGGDLFLTDVPIESLPMLKYVGVDVYLENSKIESLPKGLYVGGNLYLRKTPLSKVTTIKELRNKIEVEGRIQL